MLKMNYTEIQDINEKIAAMKQRKEQENMKKNPLEIKHIQSLIFKKKHPEKNPRCLK